MYVDPLNKGWSNFFSFLVGFFGQLPIYLKIDVLRVRTGHSSHNNFQVNRINRFSDIDVWKLAGKTIRKKRDIIFGAPFIWQTEVACRPPRMYKYVLFNCVRN